MGMEERTLATITNLSLLSFYSMCKQVIFSVYTLRSISVSVFQVSWKLRLLGTYKDISDVVGGSREPGHHLTHLPDTGTQLRVRGQQVAYKGGEYTYH